ncbi:hypothetical protein [Sphingobium fluviale]|nr:hypothetical protein [Sphingobium fluviale]
MAHNRPQEKAQGKPTRGSVLLHIEAALLAVAQLWACLQAMERLLM